MSEDPRRVWTFFYGSFINLEVLGKVEAVPQDVEVACLRGFDIRVQPLATLVASEKDSVYGIVARLTHPELERLYSQNWVGAYHPEAVLVETKTGQHVSALCYIATPGETRAAAPDYVGRIVGPAKQYGFPDWYIDRLKRFLS